MSRMRRAVCRRPEPQHEWLPTSLECPRPSNVSCRRTPALAALRAHPAFARRRQRLELHDDLEAVLDFGLPCDAAIVERHRAFVAPTHGGDLCGRVARCLGIEHVLQHGALVGRGRLEAGLPDAVARLRQRGLGVGDARGVSDEQIVPCALVGLSEPEQVEDGGDGSRSAARDSAATTLERSRRSASGAWSRTPSSVFPRPRVTRRPRTACWVASRG